MAESGADPVSGRQHVWRVPPENEGERLDRHAAATLDIPRNQIHRWIADGRILVAGEPAKASTRLGAGARITADPPLAAEERIRPEPGDLEVLYLDPEVIVLDKPAGVTVHPGAGRATGTLVHHLLDRFPEIAGIGGPGRPGIVHRLDRGTSGVMVVARTVSAYRALSRAFAERRVEKTYLALVHGKPADREVIEAPIGRHPQRRKEMTVTPGGRPAVTAYTTLARGKEIALLEIDLGTGRTHQIRVHLKSRGLPLIGDPVYGEARWKALPRRLQGPLRDFPRPSLHARRLVFEHPASREKVAFEAPVPEDLIGLWTEVTGEGFPVG